MKIITWKGKKYYLLPKDALVIEGDIHTYFEDYDLSNNWKHENPLQSFIYDYYRPLEENLLEQYNEELAMEIHPL